MFFHIKKNLGAKNKIVEITTDVMKKEITVIT